MRAPKHVVQITKSMENLSYLNSVERMLEIANTLAVHRLGLQNRVGSISGSELDKIYEERDHIILELRSAKLHDKTMDSFEALGDRVQLITLDTEGESS